MSITPVHSSPRKNVDVTTDAEENGGGGRGPDARDAPAKHDDRTPWERLRKLSSRLLRPPDARRPDAADEQDAEEREADASQERLSSLVRRVLEGKKGVRVPNPVLQALLDARDSAVNATKSDESLEGAILKNHSPSSAALHELGNVDESTSIAPISPLPETISQGQRPTLAANARGEQAAALQNKGAKARGRRERRAQRGALSANSSSEVDISLNPVPISARDIKELARNKSYKLRSEVSLRQLQSLRTEAAATSTLARSSSSASSKNDGKNDDMASGENHSLRFPKLSMSKVDLGLLLQHRPCPDSATAKLNAPSAASPRGKDASTGTGVTRAASRLVSFAAGSDGESEQVIFSQRSIAASDAGDSVASPLQDPLGGELIFRLPSLNDMSHLTEHGGNILMVVPASRSTTPRTPRRRGRGGGGGHEQQDQGLGAGSRLHGSASDRDEGHFGPLLVSRTMTFEGGTSSLSGALVTQRTDEARKPSKSKFGMLFCDDDLLEEIETGEANGGSELAAATAVISKKQARTKKAGNEEEHNPYRDNSALPLIRPLPDARSIVAQYEHAQRADERKISQLKHMLTHPAIISEYEEKEKAKDRRKIQQGEAELMPFTHDQDASNVKPWQLPRQQQQQHHHHHSHEDDGGTVDQPFEDRFEQRLATLLHDRRIFDPHGPHHADAKTQTRGCSDAVPSKHVHSHSIAGGGEGAPQPHIQDVVEAESRKLELLRLRRMASGRTLEKSRKMKGLLAKPAMAGTSHVATVTPPGTPPGKRKPSAGLNEIDARLRSMQVVRAAEPGGHRRTVTPQLLPKSGTRRAPAVERRRLQPLPSRATVVNDSDKHRISSTSAAVGVGTGTGTGPCRRSPPSSPTRVLRDRIPRATPAPTCVSRGSLTDDPSQHKFYLDEFSRSYESPYKQQSRSKSRRRNKNTDEEFGSSKRVVRRYKLQNIFRFRESTTVERRDSDEPLMHTCEPRVWPPGILATLIARFHQMDELHVGQVHLDTVLAFTDFFEWEAPPRRDDVFRILTERSGILNLMMYLELMFPHVPTETLEQNIIEEHLKAAVEQKFWTELCEEPQEALPQMYNIFLKLRGDDLRGVCFKSFHRHFRTSLPEGDLQRLFSLYDKDGDKHLSFYEFAAAIWPGYSSKPFPASEALPA